MTTRKPSKGLPLLLAAAALMIPSAFAAQRVASYSEALEKAGPDGIVAYCYGPDWNQRSVRMLKSFWESAATEEAAGNAAMVAVPFFEDNTAKGADEAAGIRGGMKSPPFNVCPSVIMMDKDGRVYATLVGSDYLGDEKGELGAQNIKAKLEEFRKQQELLAKAEGLAGVEKAKVLMEITNLSITAPQGLLEAVELADPSDKTGATRRLKHSALKFMYKQLDTTDGFLKPDYVPDFDAIKEECFKIVEDEAYLPVDRQAAYNLFLGEARRQNIPNGQLKGHIRKNMKIDETTWYGKACAYIAEKWTTGSNRLTPEQRKAQREAKKQAAKDKRDKRRRDAKADREIDIE